ncbi:MAG: [LysW]-aminoadipate kinase [Anaerolineae bacterium]|nr:[LysW]-aminoadipate kinase [Anaerolineae bacterium]
MENNNILVVKLGGGEGLDMPRSCADIARIAQTRPVVVVHGVSAKMNQMCEDLGISVQMLTSPSGHSSRYTNPRIRDIFVAAARAVNEDIIEWLATDNIHAVGLTHEESVVISGERKQALRAVVNGRVRIIRDDYSGRISAVNRDCLLNRLNSGYVPVLPPMAISRDGLLNIDGDRASAAVAAELNADELVILSNVQGLFRDFSDSDSLVPQVSRNQLSQAMDWAEGRMKRKVLGAQEAIEGGVQRVIIGDGRISHPVTNALCGAGTTFLGN